MDEEINKHVLRTGTLTMGIVCKDGIVLAADNRVTYAGRDNGVKYFAGKANKILRINERILSTIAGVASDAVRALKIIGAELKLKELKTKEEVSMSESASLISNMLYQNLRTPSMIPSIAHFLVAGYDATGISLYDLTPDGYLEKVETYEATGAPFQAHAVLDSDYKAGLSLDEGIKLAIKAFKATIGREPGVGDGIDVYTIKPGEIKQVLDQEVISELRNVK